MEESWNFPNCIGALDGKHIANSGSSYFNYKKFHSLVLMAMCDAQYCFTLVDIGNYGRDNDANILNNSLMGMALKDDKLYVPPPRKVNDDMLPYVIFIFFFISFYFKFHLNTKDTKLNKFN